MKCLEVLLPLTGRPCDGYSIPAPTRPPSTWFQLGPVTKKTVLGQRKVKDKFNEISAISELLELLELKGAIMTVDAMGVNAKFSNKSFIEC